MPRERLQNARAAALGRGWLAGEIDARHVGRDQHGGLHAHARVCSCDRVEHAPHLDDFTFRGGRARARLPRRDRAIAAHTVPVPIAAISAAAAASQPGHGARRGRSIRTTVAAPRRRVRTRPQPTDDRHFERHDRRAEVLPVIDVSTRARSAAGGSTSGTACARPTRLASARSPRPRRRPRPARGPFLGAIIAPSAYRLASSAACVPEFTALAHVVVSRETRSAASATRGGSASSPSRAVLRAARQSPRASSLHRTPAGSSSAAAAAAYPARASAGGPAPRSASDSLRSFAGSAMAANPFQPSGASGGSPRRERTRSIARLREIISSQATTTPRDVS